MNSNTSKISCKRGFTLIELLVVVLIIGILAAVAMPQYTFAVEKARLSEALTNISSLEKAIDVWLLEHGTSTGNIDTLFLGNGRNGARQLSIDMGLDCSVRGGAACANKNFMYEASCGSGGCFITVWRWSGDEDDWGVIYSLSRVRNFAEDNIWRGDQCGYDDPDGVGAKICNMLEAQGDGYYACEGC